MQIGKDRCRWRRGSIFAHGVSVALGICILSLCPIHVTAQETVSSIRERAFSLFADGLFADAVPYFEELIRIQGGSTDKQTLQALERVYYNSALCSFISGDFSGALEAFNRYNSKYKKGMWLYESHVYVADALRFLGKSDEAIRQYEASLRRFSYTPDMKADIYASIVRCYLSQDKWAEAVEPLRKAFVFAPDSLRRNRAATLLATAYLKTLDLEKIYPMTQFLLTRDSLASRSIAFNVAALEAGDILFGEERYREAFWVHRLVYPYEEVLMKAEVFLEHLKIQKENVARYTFNPRAVIRLFEMIGDTEAELAALQEKLPDYDIELMYRIARGYMEAKRFREACTLFLRLHQTGDKERTEEALYLAFVCATSFPPVSRTHAIARAYMEAFPAGNWYDELTLIDGQLIARDKDWPGVIRHFSEVLNVRPEHEQAAECLYLTGYAHFMEEEFEQARESLGALKTRFPQSELMPEAIYWGAMAAIFNADFATGAEEFAELCASYPKCAYYEDSLFRLAVCHYALGDYRTADDKLADFIARFPEQGLVPEATMTRGDIAGVEGRALDAVAFYQSAMSAPTNQINIEQYNHCAFKCAEILFDVGKYDELREHCRRYADNDRLGSNIPLAIYWGGRALIQQGAQTQALGFFRDAALKFGKDRKSVGLDMILDEWIAVVHKLSAAEKEAAWTDIDYVIRNAKNAGDAVAALRFQRLRVFRKGLNTAERDRQLNEICKSENITNASPAVLELMLDTAKTRGWTNFAVRVASAIISDFPETDYALDAHSFIADVALSYAADAPAGSERAAKFNESAMNHLTFVCTAAASSPEAASALLRLAELHVARRETDEADERYKQILGVREWRAYWPQALYGRGVCAEKAGNPLKASAYYERIYVMYQGYRDMTAKAYLARAECLRRAYEPAKALETLRAMLDSQDLKAFPEYEEAQKLFERLGGSK